MDHFAAVATEERRGLMLGAERDPVVFRVGGAYRGEVRMGASVPILVVLIPLFRPVTSGQPNSIAVIPVILVVVPDDLCRRGTRRAMRRSSPVRQSQITVLVIPLAPLVERLAGNREMPAGPRHVAGLAGRLEHLQAPVG